MIFRDAAIRDIPQIQCLRHAVKENVLSDPSLVTDADCLEYLENRGCGWVCEVGDAIVGFVIADLVAHNVWALFVHPDFEKHGIGRKLHNTMLDWYFTRTQQKIWLGTAQIPGQKYFTEKPAGKKQAGMAGSN